MSLKINKFTTTLDIGKVYENGTIQCKEKCECGGKIKNANKKNQKPQEGYDLYCEKCENVWQVKASRSNPFDNCGLLSLGGKTKVMRKTARQCRLRYISVWYDLSTNDIIEMWESDEIESHNLISRSGSALCKVSAGWTKIPIG